MEINLELHLYPVSTDADAAIGVAVPIMLPLFGITTDQCGTSVIGAVAVDITCLIICGRATGHFGAGIV